MNPFTSLFRRSKDRRAYADLMQLDDHLLRDMGLTRSDVAQMMRGRSAHFKGPRGHE
jgi:uncharacterized protein YjiS (DUF1127 family)